MASETRRHARHPMKPLHKISLQLSPNGIFFKIVNISVGGIGFLASNEEPKSDAKAIPVQLNIEASKFKTELEIVHRENGILGCQFIEPSPQLVGAIEDYFMTELAAMKVSMVETKGEDGPNGKTIFFRGQNNCELLLQEIEGRLQHFNVILFGNYLEGDGKGNLCIGKKIDDLGVAVPMGVQLFRPAPQADQHLIESVVRFIDGVEGLSENRKASLIEILSKPTVADLK